jgi:hypothetical protein
MGYGAMVTEDSLCVSTLTLQRGKRLMSIKPRSPASP